MAEEFFGKTQEQRGSVYGFVYVLTNSSMPGLIKIGQTERHPYSRAEEISAQTGVPTPFVVEYYFSVTDRTKAESAVHIALDSYRVSAGREFFRIEPDKALIIVKHALEEMILNPPSGQGWKTLIPMKNGGNCPHCSGSLVNNKIGISQYLKCIKCGQVFKEFSIE